MENDNQKKLIKEKITGRRITPARAVKLLFFITVCAIVFGVVSSCTSNLMQKVSGTKPETPTTAAQAEPETVVPETESVIPESEETEPAAPESPADQAVPTPGENVQFMPGTSEYSKAILSLFRNAAGLADNYLVSVSATSQAATWFENQTENVETYSGAIVSMDEREMLILTTCTDTEDKSLKIEFHNGSVADAYVRQFSKTDGLSLLAVSTTEGISEETLTSVIPAELADTDDLQNGDYIIAVGAPMGVIGSCTFGNIGYIDRQESGVDCTQQVLYSEIYAEPKMGTFIIDIDGRLVGVESENDSKISAGKDISRIIGSSSIRKIMNSLKTGNKRAFLGIKGKDVDFEMKYNNIPEGAYVSNVEQGSPAYNAGIRKGDVIVAVDDKVVSGMDELSRLIENAIPEDEAALQIMRGSVNNIYNEIECNVIFGER